MREIKFRAWDKEKKKMRYPEVLIWSLNGLKVWRFFDEMTKIPKLPPKQDLEFMQFTGLKDKNGKDIYEGDIVTYTSTKFTGQVIFWSCAFQISSDKTNTMVILHTTNDLEVIGNIYQDSHLLKSK